MTADFGIKISKSGYDAKTAELINQLFNSEKNCLKIVMSGSASDASIATTEVIEVTHDLGYVPAFLVFFEADDNGRWYPAYTSDITNKYACVIARTDSTKLYNYFTFTDGGNKSLKIYYYLFIDIAR
jgi:hypothetical protein